VGYTPANDPRSDGQLVDAINRGEEAAFESLYLRYRDWVVSLAFRFTSSQDDALDVMQETFIYVLSKFPGFVLRAGFKTFLYPAVKHIAIRKRGLTRRHQGGEAALPDLPAPPTNDDSNEVALVVSGLPAEQRELLLMRFVDDLTLAEIAAALGLPIGTVKSRLHRGIEALRHDGRVRKFFES